ncbi:hypothetical protein ACFLTU_05690 [Bacteroidota bacterium]
MNILSKLPDPQILLDKHAGNRNVPEVNGHLHSPHSFCSFDSIDQMFDMASGEGVKVLGINDFYTVDGYDEFARLASNNRIFPLFNIEFTGLMKDLQEQDIRVNDPNNPGRVYLSGKALRYPFNVSEDAQKFLADLQTNSQDQVREMIIKADEHLRTVDKEFRLEYDPLKEKYAENLVRERHIARAIRELIYERYPGEEECLEVFNKIFDGRELNAPLDKHAAVENQIRSLLLKKGGKAFVPEDSAAFPDIRKITDFIIEAGGLPCYPVLLDDSKGEMTAFEADWEKMDATMKSLNISCLELIPQRNSSAKLTEFVRYFYERDYVITLGTEHNSPGLFPITVKVGKDEDLSSYLKKVSYEGCCFLAAHQYLAARNTKSYDNSFRDLGNAVIKEFTS